MCHVYNALPDTYLTFIYLRHGCKKPVAEVAVLPEKYSNQTENFWKNTENFMRF